MSQSSAAWATSAQPLSTVSEWPDPRTAVEYLYCLSVDRVTTSGTVWSSRPEISSSGPRDSLSVATLACECSVKVAAATWNSGLAGDGMFHFSQSASDSSGVSALPNPYRNSSLVSDIALCRLAGLPSAGKPQRSWTSGRGNTPLIWAGSIATAAAP